MIDACDACLRRGFLIAHLAPRIAGLLLARGRRPVGLLRLSEEELLAAAAGNGVRQALDFLDGFRADVRRERLGETGMLALCRHAQRFPALLRELHDPPAVLFGSGRLEALAALSEEPAVALVGTRRPSAYGTEVAYTLGRGLGAAGIPVVSGLALGIDGTAHHGCLAGGGLPLAVLACGPDVVYPRRHRGLYERVRRSGVVLSELPPGTRPFRWSFPARNRIMAGLARMTVVVEAANPSGSLITSDFAKDLGRSVAAVPGRVTASGARGSNELLRDGAVPITRTEDVLDELFGVGVREAPRLSDLPSVPDDPLLSMVLAEAERSSSVEAIAEATGRGILDVRAALSRLEVDGYLVRRDLGGWERAAW